MVYEGVARRYIVRMGYPRPIHCLQVAPVPYIVSLASLGGAVLVLSCFHDSL